MGRIFCSVAMMGVVWWGCGGAKEWRFFVARLSDPAAGFDESSLAAPRTGTSSSRTTSRDPASCQPSLQDYILLPCYTYIISLPGSGYSHQGPELLFASMDHDLLDGLLDLEERFYKEGYDLGVADGAQAGYTEGSVFAVEKGFEKLLEMGRLYGRALVWAQRLADSHTSKQDQTREAENDSKRAPTNGETRGTDELLIQPSICKGMPSLPESSRLEKNIRNLLALVDPAAFSMENTEEAVSDIDERLKAASMKAKLIQRALGEREDTSDINPRGGKDAQALGDGTGSIEDISSLSIRH